MLALAKIKGGSHLYGLNNDQSDDDRYRIVALSPAERAFNVVSLAQGDMVGPGEVDQHEIDIQSLLNGRLDTMWALELLFAEPIGECAPEWNRLRDIRRRLCTPALCSQVRLRLRNTVSSYVIQMPREGNPAETKWIRNDQAVYKPVVARNLAHSYRMAVQLMNYIVKRELFATEFKVNREAYDRLKNNVVAVEDIVEILQVLYGLETLIKGKTGISGEFYESREAFELFWDIANTTTQAAINAEISLDDAFVCHEKD